MTKEDNLEKIKSIVFNIVVIGFISFVLLLGIEITTRLFVKKPQEIPINWEKVGLAGKARVKSAAYAAYPWAEDFYNESLKSSGASGLHYEPFSLWKHHPFQNKYITYQADGYRKTVNPQKPDCSNYRIAWVFGGSAVAGDGFLRDEDLLPSRLSYYLNQQYPGTCVSVNNYGQSGYSQGNEYVLLSQLLSQQKAPDLVLFYDGYNDVFFRVLRGYPHMAYTAFNRVTEIWAGATIKSLLVDTISHSSRFLSLFRPPPPPPIMATTPELIASRSEDLAGIYEGQMKVIEALSEQFNFHLILALQPTLYSKATRSDEEEKILLDINSAIPNLQECLETSYSLIRKKFPKTGSQFHFFDLSSVLNIKDSVYVDMVHVSPLGNDVVARRLAEAIVAKDLLKIGKKSG